MSWIEGWPAGRATADILQRKIISIPVSPCKKLRSKIYLWLRETVLWFWIVPLCLESVLTIWSPGGSDWLVCKGLSSWSPPPVSQAGEQTQGGEFCVEMGSCPPAVNLPWRISDINEVVGTLHPTQTWHLLCCQWQPLRGETLLIASVMVGVELGTLISSYDCSFILTMWKKALMEGS